MDGLDTCEKHNGIWSPNDFGDTKLFFIFSRERFSGDAFYINEKGNVMNGDKKHLYPNIASLMLYHYTFNLFVTFLYTPVEMHNI